MLTLQELFDHLAHGEFANMALGNSMLGTLTEDKYPKIVSAVNLGLGELYTRFLLSSKKCFLTQQADISVYYLRSEYDGVYLVTEDGEPFADDVIKILDLCDAAGDDVPLNNPRYLTTGAFTEATDTIRMTPAIPPKTLTVTYQAEYPKIVMTETFDPTSINLYFPKFVVNALLHFVAARVFKGKTSKSAEGETNISTTFNYQFEAACKKIIELGLAEEATEASTKFTAKGWV